MGLNSIIPLAEPWPGPVRAPIYGRGTGNSLLFTLYSHLGGRPQAASLVRGLRPRNAPGPTTCLAGSVANW